MSISSSGVSLSIGGLSIPVQQSRDERVDLLGDAGVGECFTDEATGTLKFDTFRQSDPGRDAFRLARRFGNLHMQPIAYVEAGDRQVEHDFRKIACAPLPTTLITFKSLSRCFAIEKRSEETAFVNSPESTPIQRKINRQAWVVNGGGCLVCPRSTVNHAQRRERKLGR